MSNLSRTSGPSRTDPTIRGRVSETREGRADWPVFRCYSRKFRYLPKSGQVVGNFAGVDERSAPLSTGALGYRVCGVTGPGSYANYSPWPWLLLFRKISPDAHCLLPQRRLVSNFREPGLSPFLLSAASLFLLFFFFHFIVVTHLRQHRPPRTSSFFLLHFQMIALSFCSFTVWIRANYSDRG